MPRFVLIAAVVMTIALVAMPAVQSSELQRPAEFVSGTATSISTGTPGSIDTTSHTDLEFRYHGEVFSVPYQKIPAPRPRAKPAATFGNFRFRRSARPSAS